MCMHTHMSSSVFNIYFILWKLLLTPDVKRCKQDISSSGITFSSHMLREICMCSVQEKPWEGKKYIKKYKPQRWKEKLQCAPCSSKKCFLWEAEWGLHRPFVTTPEARGCSAAGVSLRDLNHVSNSESERNMLNGCRVFRACVKTNSLNMNGCMWKRARSGHLGLIRITYFQMSIKRYLRLKDLLIGCFQFQQTD